jgi:plasmid maintenance system antidote protein VapI
MPARSLISDQLRAAILAYGTAYSLAAAVGIHRATISRFLNGKASFSMDTVDSLAAVLGLRLVQSRRAVRRRRG